jgi:DNA-directed RNA polymerase specialized sigma24 family protein
MCDNPSVTDLVARAHNGQRQAWDALVERYAPMVWSICRRHRLSGADASQVGQSVWPQLAGQLGHMRDPAALPDWLATTTVRECQRVLCAARSSPGAGPGPDAETFPGEEPGAA